MRKSINEQNINKKKKKKTSVSWWLLKVLLIENKREICSSFHCIFMKPTYSLHMVIIPYTSTYFTACSS